MQTNVETGQIEYTDVAARQDIESAMRGSIVRGLVELITNADDSYVRLEEEGQPATGRILVELEHRRKGRPYKIVVRDRAQGMDNNEMKVKLTRRGGATSGHLAGVSVRGFLCRGAKDLVAFGPVLYESIKDDKYYWCKLSPPQGYELLKRGERATKDVRTRLGIPRGNGTFVSIDVSSRFHLSQHRTLVEKLPQFFSLRDIMADSRRKVKLVNLNDPSDPGVDLRYRYPEGQVALDDEFGVEGYPGARARLVIDEAAARFEEERGSPFRQGGILVKSGRAIHEITYFGLEGSLEAQWFFGELRCDYLDKLIREYEEFFRQGAEPPPSNPCMLIARTRDGLVREHPFVERLYAAAEERFAKLVKEKQEQVAASRTPMESEDTHRRLRKLAAAAGRFMERKLREEGIELTGVVSGREIPQGFALIPPFRRMAVGESKTFSLLARADDCDPSSPVLLKKEGDEISLSSERLWLQPRRASAEILSATFKVQALSLTHACMVSARHNGHSDEAYIEVVAEREEKEIVPPTNLEFDHDYYRVSYGKSKGVLLKAPNELVDKHGPAAQVRSDAPEDVVPRGQLVRLALAADGSFWLGSLRIQGRTLGKRGRVTATLGPATATCTIEVVQRANAYSFDIKIVPDDFGNQRAKWTPDRSELHIAGKHKSVARYLGPGPDSGVQGAPHFRVLLAEIVADNVCRRILEERAEAGALTEDMDAPAFYSQHYELMSEFVAMAHESQLPSAEAKALRESLSLTSNGNQEREKGASG
jgi:hypothetical protein